MQAAGGSRCQATHLISSDASTLHNPCHPRRACASGYDPAVRVAIGRTVEVLGGRVTESMNRRNTHLILPVATGPPAAGHALLGRLPGCSDWRLLGAGPAPALACK